MTKNLWKTYENNPGNIYISLQKIQMPCGKFGKKIILDVLDKHTLFQLKKVRSKKAPRITNDIKNLMNTRDRSKRTAILINNENDWLNFRTT